MIKRKKEEEEKENYIKKVIKNITRENISIEKEGLENKMMA